MIDARTLPKEPGVYLFKDKSDEIIYVGKAKSLRSRVGSYFGSGPHSPKTRVLVNHIASVEHIIVDNEVEALLLENRLIKKHKPKYNISLKDGKTYAYIKLTDERFPRIQSTRTVAKKGKYFGPYIDGAARNDLVQLSVRLFQLRTCRTLPKRPCLNYHIGLCTAPCAGYVTDEQYHAQVAAAESFLKGNTHEVLVRLKSEMKSASEKQRYEVALEKKRQIEAVEHTQDRQKVDLVKRYDQDVIVMKVIGERAHFVLFSITRGVLAGKKEFRFEYEEEIFKSFVKQYYSTRALPNEIVVNAAFWEDEAEWVALEEYFTSLRGGKVTLTLPLIGEKKALVRLAEKNLEADDEALCELRDALNLSVVPSIIECFDISNLGSTHIVAGMTRWVDGLADKQGYRRFLLKEVVGKKDDFASMHEVVFRRYKKILEEKGEIPSLILIDGGVGQLNAALSSLQELGTSIPIVSLAKREEEIYTPGRADPLKFDKNSRMMLLLRRIRDSTHRQAITYNRKRREMGFRDEISK